MPALVSLPAPGKQKAGILSPFAIPTRIRFFRQEIPAEARAAIQMQSVRTAQRRRRVVLDEVVQSQENLQDQEVASGEPGDHLNLEERATYNRLARRRYHLRISDLIPTRVLTMVMVVGTLVTLLGTLLWLDQQAPAWQSSIGHEAVATLQLGNGNSLAGWFGCLLMLAAAAGCGQIYYLRKHRTDDYHANYRWWLWIAAILVIASLNCVSGIVDLSLRLAGEWLESGAKFSLGWGWQLVKLAVLLTIAGRFAHEFRYSRAALASCAAVTLAFSASLILPLVPGFEQTSFARWASTPALSLITQTCIVTTVLFFSRFVYLEAHGLIAVKNRSSKNDLDSEAEIDRPATSSKRTTGSSTRRKTAPSPDQDSAEQGAASRSRRAGSTKRNRLSSKSTPATSADTAKSADKRKPKPAAAASASAKPSADTDPGPRVAAPARDESADPQDVFALDENLDDGRPLSKAQRRKLKKQRRSRAA